MLMYALPSVLILMGALASLPGQIIAGPGGEVSIMFHGLSNPGYKKYAGGRVQCCDLFCSGCDPYFDLCLKMRSNGGCHAHFRSNVYRRAPRRLIFKSGSNLGSGKTNPLKYTFSSWEGKLYLNIDVKDFDLISSNDNVDSYHYSTSVIPNPDMRAQRWHRISLKGRVTTMTLSYSVRCNKDYYGPRCTTWCQPRDDFRGHYTCDNVSGSKICNEDWYGPLCTISCDISNNNYQGHYRCSPEGDKICLPKWYGDSCTTYCVPKHDKNQGYICDKQGGKICLKDYYGIDCDTYCNSQSSAYKCNKVTGDKICNKGWSGKECNKKCSPNNDGDCDENGGKLCRPNWFGDNCDVHCKPHDDDAIGHYKCDNQTGSKICLPNWYGESCNKFCDPQDNTTSGYTCNSTSGDKICRAGWEGPNCDCFGEASDQAGYSCNSTTGQRVCLEGWAGIYCNISIATPTPTAQACATPAEIGVLFDSSASIGGPNFLLMKYFIASLVEQVAASPPRFSVIRYNAWPILYLSFTKASRLTADGVVKRIVQLKYAPGQTRTDRALNAARTLFTKKNGGGVGNPKLLIVMSDGKSKMDPKTYRKALSSLQAAGVEVIAVGVGGDICVDDLKAIAMNKVKNVYHVSNFLRLAHVLKKLEKRIPCSNVQQPN